MRSIFSAWIRSPGHRANILGAFAEIGIGLRVGDLEGKTPAPTSGPRSFGSRAC